MTDRELLEKILDMCYVIVDRIDALEYRLESDEIMIDKEW